MKKIDPKAMRLQVQMLKERISQQAVARVLKVSQARVHQLLNSEKFTPDNELRLRAAIDKILKERS